MKGLSGREKRKRRCSMKRGMRRRRSMKKGMRQSLLAGLLCMCMCLTCLPANAAAADLQSIGTAVADSEEAPETVTAGGGENDNSALTEEKNAETEAIDENTKTTEVNEENLKTKGADEEVTKPAVQTAGEGKEYERLYVNMYSYYTFYIGINADADKAEAAISQEKTSGLDNTVWNIEESAESQEGYPIVTIQNYANGTYLAAEESDVVCLDSVQDKSRWIVESIENTDKANYKNLATGQYLVVGASGYANIPVMQDSADMWGQEGWSRETVSTEELINKPGDTISEELRAELSSMIEEARGYAAEEDKYTTATTTALLAALDRAKLAVACVNLSAEVAEKIADELAEAIGGLENTVDCPPNPLEKEGYYLDFDDEFEGDTLDSSKWLDEYLPHWTSDEQNAKARYEMRDGNLVLKLNKEDQPWSELDGTVVCSGIMTYNKNYLHDFSNSKEVYDRPSNYFDGYKTKYGYFEMRAKIHGDGGGGHNAWWLVGDQGENADYDSWVNSGKTGEIDILETPYYADDTWRICAIEWGDDKLSNWSDIPSYNEPVPHGEPSKEYHVYGMEWTPEKLYFYYDNELHYTVDRTPDYEMGMVLSMYVGAGFSGIYPTNEEEWPKEFAVDYMRVWKPIDGYEGAAPDKSSLTRWVKNVSVEAGKTDVYTAESLEGLNGEITASNALLEREDVTAAELSNQVLKLQAALNSLEVKKGETPDPDDKPNPDDKPAPDDKPNPDDKPATDDKPAPDDKPNPDDKPAPDDKPIPDNKPAPDDKPSPDNKPAADNKLSSDHQPSGKGNVNTANYANQAATVKTGDHASPMLLAAAMLIALGFAITALKISRKRNR